MEIFENEPGKTPQERLVEYKKKLQEKMQRINNTKKRVMDAQKSGIKNRILITRLQLEIANLDINKLQKKIQIEMLKIN